MSLSLKTHCRAGFTWRGLGYHIAAVSPITSLFRGRKSCLLLLSTIFGVSRGIYHALGVRFDADPPQTYWQMIDPALLRDAPWQSLLYLRTQLPGFNLYLAVITHLFPRHSAAAFQATYLAMGLILAVCLFLLLDRLRVNRPLAVLIAAIYTISPVTVLYENWLFYEYPLAVLFCISAVFLHRYATSHRRFDGILFFTSLAFIGLLRVIYHLVWFGMIAAVLIYALPRCRRRTALCAAAPGALLLLVYLKSVILFGTCVPGSDVYGGFSLATLTSGSLSRDALAAMVAQKTISPILLHDFTFEDEELLRIVPIPPKTGIRILDDRVKSTGAINMDSLWMASIGRQLRQDGLVLLRSHPAATLATVRQNIERYFLPADIGWPFGGTPHANRQVLSPLLKSFDLLMSGNYSAHKFAFVSWITTPLLLWFGLRRSMRWLKRAVRRGPRANARDLTIVFAFANIAYLTAIAIFYASGDQNRYLFEVFPLFAILLGSLIALAMRRCRASQLWIRRIPVRISNSAE